MNWLKYLNLVLAMAFIVQLVLGLILDEFRSPFLKEFHEVLGLTLGGMILIHLFLNRTWVLKTYFRK